MTVTVTDQAVLGLGDCPSQGQDKYWTILDDCGDGDSFFKVQNRVTELCIADPLDCSICNTDIGFVDCESEDAAWFSYGNLHKTSPKAYYLYSARCWLNEGLISTLATPSLDAMTCPDDQSAGACAQLEWNLDRFSKDVMYYEWSFNKMRRDDCAFILFTET